MHQSQPESIGIRQAKAEFSEVIDEVTAGASFMVCRRATPVAVLMSIAEYERFRELQRRDADLKAVLRGKGVGITPWTTPKIIEAVTRLEVVT